MERDQWKQELDKDPLARGVRMIKRTLRVGREFISLEHDDQIVFSGVFEGVIEIRSPNAVVQRPDEDYETLKRRVQPIHEISRVSSEIEAEEQARKRMESGLPDSRDILDFIARGEPGIYTLLTLHAAICGWTLQDSTRFLWAGRNPLYCPAFDGCATHEERIRAWKSLSASRQEALRRQYGEYSEVGLQTHRNRERFTQHLGAAQEELLLPTYTGRGDLLFYPQMKQKEAPRRAHIKAFMEHLPAWQRTGNFYEVVRR